MIKLYYWALWSSRLMATWALLLALAAPGPALDDVIDSPMYASPELPTARVVTVFRDAKGLWLRALQRPEADFRCKAADAIALAARRGVTGLETTVAPLWDALDLPDQHPAVRLAIAKALIELDARKAAPSLLRQALAGGNDLREIVEPALARWKYRDAGPAWLARLQDSTTPPRSLVLAIQGLAALEEDKAADRLRELVLSDQAIPAVRLEAARALGSLRGNGLEDDAARLAADTSPRGLVARLAAATLLRGHRGDKTVRLLQRLTDDKEPAAAAVALARLMELGPELVPGPERLAASADANVRLLVVDVLFRRPTEEHLRLLRDRLDDVHPAVRVKARQRLHESAARQELRNPVIAAATQALEKTSWRCQEQAAILLAQLDHKPAAKRLVELLASDRAEVGVTAAWAVRKLAIPETLPQVLRHVEATLGQLEGTSRPAPAPVEPPRRGRQPGGRAPRGGPSPAARAEMPAWGIDFRLAQLNQFMGQQRHAPASALLRRFVPRGGASAQLSESRAAAIWALGMIYDGKSVPDLATALEGRLNDHPPPPAFPEAPPVLRMSGVTLGRLRAKQALASLQQYCQTQEATGTAIHDACGWAIEQLTGEVLRPPKMIQRIERDWFLSPIE